MTKKNEFDLIVIGGGPGGYVAAIRASQLGLRVMCVEKRSTPGGTCLNVGCIPSKTLLHSSHLYEHSKNNLDDFGININGELKLDLAKMMKNKNEAVAKLTKGVDSLLKKNKIFYLNGTAKIVDKNCVQVANENYKSKNE